MIVALAHTLANVAKTAAHFLGKIARLVLTLKHTNSDSADGVPGYVEQLRSRVFAHFAAVAGP